MLHFLCSDFFSFSLNIFSYGWIYLRIISHICVVFTSFKKLGIFFKHWPHLLSFPYFLLNLLLILQFVTLISSFWRFSLKLLKIKRCVSLNNRRAIHSSTSLMTNYTTYKNVLSVSPWRKQHLLCRLQQYCKNRILDKTYMPTPTSEKVLYHIACRAGKKCVTRHSYPLSTLIITLSSRSNPQHTGHALDQSYTIQKIHCNISHLNKLICKSATFV